MGNTTMYLVRSVRSAANEEKRKRDPDALLAAKAHTCTCLRETDLNARTLSVFAFGQSVNRFPFLAKQDSSRTESYLICWLLRTSLEVEAAEVVKRLKDLSLRLVNVLVQR